MVNNKCNLAIVANFTLCKAHKLPLYSKRCYSKHCKTCCCFFVSFLLLKKNFTSYIVATLQKSSFAFGDNTNLIVMNMHILALSIVSRLVVSK